MITNQVLATFPFLCRLSPESRQLLDASARLQNAARATTLLRQGDRLRHALFVVSGRLRVYAISPAGDEVTLYQIESGQSCPLAMNALLREHPHQAWVSVISASARLLSIPAAVYRDLFQNEPAVRDYTLDLLSDRIASLMTTIEALSLQPLRDRVLNYLRQNADASGRVQTTHQALALALGTAREVVSRRLRELRDTGQITTQRGHIQLL